MSVLLFYRVAGSIAGVDSGVGDDLAILAPTEFKSVSDFGQSLESASATTSVTPDISLPDLMLEVSFDADSGPTYKETVVIARPTVYYRLGETTGPVVDQVGNLSLTIAGGVTRGVSSLLPGDSDTCYDLDGSSGFMYGFDNGLLDPVLDPVEEGEQQQLKPVLLTLEIVVNPDTLTGVLAARFGANQNIWIFGLESGHPYLTVKDITGTSITYQSNSLLSVGTSYHIVMVIRENYVEMFIEGELVDIFPKSWLYLVRDTASLLSIGAMWNGSSWSNHFNGKIDEPAIYLTDLPHEDISYHSEARSATGSYIWTQISNSSLKYLKELSVKRGRQDLYRDPETGVFTGILRNQDRRFDPGYTSSPYYPNLKPARPVRLRVSKSGINYDLFRGDVEDWPQNWQGRTNDVPLTALDGFDIIANVNVNLTRPVEKSGARIHAILDAAAWPISLRRIDEGQEYIREWVEKEGGAIELLFKVTAAESGSVYIAGDGAIVFQERNMRYTPPFSTIKATFSNVPGVGEYPLVHADVVKDKDQIKNHVRIKVEDTDEVYTAQSAESILQHRKRTFQQELPLLGITEAQMRAEWILSHYKDPFVRVKSVVLEPQMHPELWAQCLGREVGDRIRFKIYPPGPTAMHDLQAIIEYIEHKYVVGRWTTLWHLSPADTSNFWILGTSELGVTTKLAY